MNLLKVQSINIWDEEWEVGGISVGTGEEIATTNSIRSKNYCECLPNTDYYLKCGDYTNRYYMAIIFYDTNKNHISGAYYTAMSITSPNNAKYFKIATNSGVYIYGATYNHDIQICLNSESEKTTYHPHWLLGLNQVGQAMTCDISQMLPDWCGVVDLGDLNYTKYTHGTYGVYFYAIVTNLNISPDLPFVPLINEKYKAVRRYVADFVDMTICADGSSTVVTQIQIKDSTFDDATALKASLVGKKLFFKKAT